MDRVSDEQLENLILFAKNDVDELSCEYNEHTLSALTELRERRAMDSQLIAATKGLTQAMDELRERRERDKAEAVANDQECPYCGEYHDKRTVCNDRYVKEFSG